MPTPQEALYAAMQGQCDEDLPPRPVPYRVQVCMRLTEMFSNKSSCGLHVQTGQYIDATRLTKKETSTYEACLDVMRNYVTGEDACGDAYPPDDDQV